MYFYHLLKMKASFHLNKVDILVCFHTNKLNLGRIFDTMKTQSTFDTFQN